MMNFKIYSCSLCLSFCRQEQLFCKDCQQEINHSLFPRHAFDFKHNIPLFYAGEYRGAYKKLLLKLKSQSEESCPHIWNFYEELISYWCSELSCHQPQSVTNVPNHPIRKIFKASSTFNFAQQISQKLKCNFENELLSYKMNWNLEGQKNSPNLWRKKTPRHLVKKKASTAQRILLVDDVIASGASIKRAIDLLGPKKICAIFCIAKS